MRYVITSLPPEEANPRRLLQRVCQHWHIENKLQYDRDVTFAEDRSTVRTGHAPWAMAALRNTVIGWLLLHREPKIVAAWRHFAGNPPPSYASYTKTSNGERKDTMPATRAADRVPTFC